MFDDLKTKIHGLIHQTNDIDALDRLISDCIKVYFSKSSIYHSYHFYSEEDQEQGLELPLILVDPIDGTNEFHQGGPGYAVSLSILHSFDLKDPKNIHWIYNLSNQDEILWMDGELKIQKTDFSISTSRKYKTVISRTENRKYKLQSLNQLDIHFEPMGSIAYKLMLLALGTCDFVISFHPKNIWDIFAGSSILSNQGFICLNNREEVQTMNQLRYKGPLVWCKSKDEKIIAELIEKVAGETGLGQI